MLKLTVFLSNPSTLPVFFTSGAVASQVLLFNLLGGLQLRFLRTLFLQLFELHHLFLRDTYFRNTHISHRFRLKNELLLTDFAAVKIKELL